jgi:phage terminase large subunit-like protein
VTDFSTWPLEYLQKVGTEIGYLRDWEPRPAQCQPNTEWFCWFVRAGRGFGKTRTASETVKDWLVEAAVTRTPIRVAIVAATFGDGRDTMMEGESGLLAVLPSFLIPKGVDEHWNRSNGELMLADGSLCKIHSAERPNRLRGPQWHKAWGDEPAEFKDATKGISKDSTVFNLFAGLRLGTNPQVIFTGTPKPVRLIKELVARCAERDKWVETTGSTYDNLDNLAPAFREEVVELYEGSRLGEQELYGRMMEDQGDVFDVAKLVAVTRLPAGARFRARCWDLAASEVTPENADPDWTVGTLISLDLASREYCIEDMVRFRLRAGARDLKIRETALRDAATYSGGVVVYVEQEPGSGGKAQVDTIAAELDGIARVKKHSPTGRKPARAQPVAGSIDQGRVSVLELTGEAWPLLLRAELGEFLEDESHPHDDIVDTLSTFWAVAPRKKTKDRGVLPQSVASDR